MQNSKSLWKVAEDGDWRVRKAVARNANATQDILQKLAEDGGWSVRKAVAENANATQDILQKLAEDED